MKFCDIYMRDPFILAEDGVYYLYGTRGEECWEPGSGTGLDVYASRDLETWEKHEPCLVCPPEALGRYRYWAPEVHRYQGAYYLLVTLSDAKEDARGTYIFRAESPLGPFTAHSIGPATPADRWCLDGTLYVEDGVPYMIYCDEWAQYPDKLGKMCIVRLKPDLTGADGEPVFLFDAKAPSWMTPDNDIFVTDGPFLFHDTDGRLGMIWSSHAGGQYVEGAAYSESGRAVGPWVQCDRLVFEKDGGHGMFFKTFGGKWKFTFHTPNKTTFERPAVMDVPAWLKLQ